MSKNTAPKEPKPAPTDYPELRKQINDFESTFYGPHGCQSCGSSIIKMAIEQGGHAFTIPAANEVSGKYRPHVCIETTDPRFGYSHFESINYSVRHLAGKILTITDACVSEKEQRKATKDLIREAFKQTLEQLSSVCFSRNAPGSPGSGSCTSPIEPLQQL